MDIRFFNHWLEKSWVVVVNNIFWRDASAAPGYQANIQEGIWDSSVLVTHRNDCSGGCGTGAEDNFEADPQIVSFTDAKLKIGSASPCRGAGADLNTYQPRYPFSTSVWLDSDILNHDFGADGGWDVGAHEYVGGSGGCGTFITTPAGEDRPARACMVALLLFVAPLIWIGFSRRNVRRSRR